jgi:hypothetical protein
MSSTSANSSNPGSPASYNIKDTSSLTGLSPSVLRIWELRYGWPNPRRKANGYRTYQSEQIEDLKRVAELVKNGMPISRIIVGGAPQWPASDACQPSPRQLTKTRLLPAPPNAPESLLHRDLIQAFASLDPRAVKELLQRIFWTVRPAEEPRAALAPALVALAELRGGRKPMPGADEIQTCVHDRCVQLLRMQRIPGDALLVVPARGGDHALAALVAAMLCFRGVPARAWTELREPSMPYVVASDGECPPRRGGRHLGTITILGDGGTPWIGDLLEPNALPAFVPNAAASGTAKA